MMASTYKCQSIIILRRQIFWQFSLGKRLNISKLTQSRKAEWNIWNVRSTWNIGCSKTNYGAHGTQGAAKQIMEHMEHMPRRAQSCNTLSGKESVSSLVNKNSSTAAEETAAAFETALENCYIEEANQQKFKQNKTNVSRTNTLQNEVLWQALKEIKYLFFAEPSGAHFNQSLHLIANCKLLFKTTLINNKQLPKINAVVSNKTAKLHLLRS